MKPLNFFRGVAIAAMLAGCLPSEAATLKIGDAAPPLQVGKWVQGEPVSAFDSNHVYIVEFWATWCAPCRASIPHLNETWQKFKDKDLIVIGQDVSEEDDSKVPAFVTKMGENMTYRVALDDKSQDAKGAMSANWMKAAGQNGIPTAFVVNRQGKIAWIGHPMTLEESVLEQILADKFDVAAFAAEFDKRQQEQEQNQALNRKLGQAIKDKQWDQADEAAAAIEKSMPENERFRIGPVRVQILLGRKDHAAAYKLAGELSDGAPGNAILQNEVAWLLATAEGVDHDGLLLAEKLAKRAADTPTGAKEPGILDTLARAQFMVGNTNAAVVTEQRAVELAPDATKPYLQKTLNAYQEGKLPTAKE